jgi:hypothetical protein
MLTALSVIGPVIISIGIMDFLDMPGMESSFEAPSHIKYIYASSLLGWKSLSAQMYSSIFWRSFSKVYGGFLAKYCVVGPGQSPLIMASMTISLGTVGA